MSLLLDLPRIRFGYGCARDLKLELAAAKVSRPLFITDAGVQNSGGVRYVIESSGISSPAIYDGVTEPPVFASVEAAAEIYRNERCDGIVAIGGGAVIDTAKMTCVVATHPGTITDYAGHGDRITDAVAPLIVLPTTAGSGSEVSPSTGIHPAAGLEALRTRSPGLVAAATLCDPTLTLTKPPRLTAASGLDALTHCIEGFLSPANNPVIDAMALDGIERIAQYLETAITDGQHRVAREQMLLGSLEGGIAIGKGLGPAHALATAFSVWAIPHGVLAAVCLLPSLDLMEQHVPERTAQVARAMKLADGVTAADGFRALLERVQDCCGLPVSLKGLCPGADPAALAEACALSPVNLSSPYRPTAQEYLALVNAVL